MENFDEATKSRALRAAASFLATWIPYPAESNHEYSAVEVCDRLREINTDLPPWLHFPSVVSSGSGQSGVQAKLRLKVNCY